MVLDDEIRERIRQEGYKDQDGKPILLESLVRREPEWAANVIRSLKWKVKESELDLLSMEQNKDYFESQLTTLKARIAELEEAARWRNWDDTLPLAAMPDVVLGLYDNGTCEVLVKMECYFACDTWNGKRHVTHWRPIDLPEEG